MESRAPSCRDEALARSVDRDGGTRLQVMCEEAVMGPAESGDGMDPVDVLRELTRVGGVLAPVVLERCTIRRVGEVETCDESPPAIAEFVVEHRLREAGTNEGETKFRLLR